MERLRALFAGPKTPQEYEPIEEDDDDHVPRPGYQGSASQRSFSLLEYSVFLLLGVAMLWAWNMFLAAAPYFQSRFLHNKGILTHFQSSITSVSCITNLSSMLLLSKMQSNASYPKRIIYALVINIVVFALLTISTSNFRGISSGAYFAFTLLMVFMTSVATGLCQNGSFAFAASFGRPEYIQAIMTGQGVAGVLPSVAQIFSVLAVPEPKHWEDDPANPVAAPNEKSTSAFIYFLTATGISAITLVAVLPLVLKRQRTQNSQVAAAAEGTDGPSARKVVSMMTLYRKLKWLPPTIFICFVATMFFPVFTQKILSVVPADEAGRLLQPATFIPLGFLFWNIGDLSGRLLTLVPSALRPRPILLFLFALLRCGFIPSYLLCNLEGKGAAINSDAFYLLIVQFGFGITNGFVGSSTMMAAQQYVDGPEREATGGFMALNLVAGLTAGSLLSFTVS